LAIDPEKVVIFGHKILKNDISHRITLQCSYKAISVSVGGEAVNFISFLPIANGHGYCSSISVV